jgi:hypothetical protein
MGVLAGLDSRIVVVSDQKRAVTCTCGKRKAKVPALLVDVLQSVILIVEA